LLHKGKGTQEKWNRPRFYRVRYARALRVRAQGLRIREKSASNFQGPICILAIYTEIGELSGSTREKRGLSQISMRVGLGYGDDLLRRQMLITIYVIIGIPAIFAIFG
jgi:uncharacterized ferredoxin-like protein